VLELRDRSVIDATGLRVLVRAAAARHCTTLKPISGDAVIRSPEPCQIHARFATPIQRPTDRTPTTSARRDERPVRPGSAHPSEAWARGLRHIAFAVEDIDAVVAGVRARGW
jgi:hypothetical protein